MPASKFLNFGKNWKSSLAVGTLRTLSESAPKSPSWKAICKTDRKKRGNDMDMLSEPRWKTYLRRRLRDFLCRECPCVELSRRLEACPFSGGDARRLRTELQNHLVGLRAGLGGLLAGGARGAEVALFSNLIGTVEKPLASKGDE